MNKLCYLTISLAAITASYANDNDVNVDKDIVVTVSVAPSNETVTEIVVAKVAKNSRADIEGIIAGDKIVNVNGCAIPGCPRDLVFKALLEENETPQILELHDQQGELYTFVKDS